MNCPNAFPCQRSINSRTFCDNFGNVAATSSFRKPFSEPNFHTCALLNGNSTRDSEGTFCAFLGTTQAFSNVIRKIFMHMSNEEECSLEELQRSPQSCRRRSFAIFFGWTEKPLCELLYGRGRSRSVSVLDGPLCRKVGLQRSFTRKSHCCRHVVTSKLWQLDLGMCNENTFKKKKHVSLGL